jgi:hypothetical protein
VARTVSTMRNSSRIALRAGGGAGVDEPPEGVGCMEVDSSSTTNPTTAGSAVVMAASATGIGMEYLTMAYRA